MHNAPLEKTSARIEVKDGLQSTRVAGEGQEGEKEKVPVKVRSDVKGENT